MQQKKGQAAMEFLMTYGWAILAAIVAIGVLAYFGVFSPGKLTGSSAIVNNPFYASSWLVNTSTVQLELTNNGGDVLIVNTLTVNGTGASTGTNCATPSTFGATITNPGAITLFSNMTCSGDTLVAGNNFAGDIKIRYQKQGSALNQTVTGTIRTNII